jgi:CMP/dCMP kinase
VSFVVTIDGPAGAGKSTTARAVAARLGCLYVDTGALYRAVALKALEQGVRAEDAEGLERLLGSTTLDLGGTPQDAHVWLDGVDVSARIRTPEVSEMSSRLAARPPVRRRLVGVQRALRDRGPIVGEGRDLGTVVFPDAEVKIYLDATPGERVRRRHRELLARGIAASMEQVQEEIERRDGRDRGRSDSPLRAAEGAVIIDTTGMDIEAQIEAVLDVVRRHPGQATQDPRPGPGRLPGGPPGTAAGGPGGALENP